MSSKGTTMKSSTLRRASASCASVLATAGLALALAGPATAAPSVSQLTDNIRAGVMAPRATAENSGRGGASGPITIPDGTTSSSSQTSGVGPAQTRFIPAFAYSLTHPNVAPPGANDYSCKPKQGQRPVVLVHGTWESAYDNFAMISPELTRAGFCTYTFNYGITEPLAGGGAIALIPGANGTGDIPRSAGQLQTFVDSVRYRTGASKVDIIGHSQGGLLARQYLRFNGGRDKVKKLITLGATNHGTTILGIGTLGRAINNLGINILGAAQLPVGVAGIQQVVGSDVVNRINAGGETLPGIDYTIIRTDFDEVTTPPQSTSLKAGPDATVNNVALQENCPVDHSDHVSMSYSPRAVSLIKRALDGGTTPLVCSQNEFVIG